MMTQILSTIGPATIDRIKQLYDAGISGIRINSSHGSIKQHRKIIENTRKISKEIFIVYDIKGPKIRIGDIPGPALLTSGEEIILLSNPDNNSSPFPSTENIKKGIPVTYEHLYKYVKPGHRLVIDDGLIGLKVERIKGRKIISKVEYGGILRSRKGINHPDTIIEFPYTVEEDIPFINFAVKSRVDYIADSFVRDAQDVLEMRSRLKNTDIKIISKIENPQGVDAFDEILEKTDSVMVARGDLGVELDPWKIPELQKTFIEKSNKAEKPVIVATQMLESMVEDPRPKRSDVSDIANAIYDGADVLMLSGETSVGKYPVLAVKMMSKIIKQTESTQRYKDKKKTVHSLGLSS